MCIENATTRADLAQRMTKGEQRRRDTDYEEIEARILAKLKKLPSYDLDWVECMINHLMARTQQPPKPPTISEQLESARNAPESSSGTHGQPETFQSLCENDKNPLPLGGGK